MNSDHLRGHLDALVLAVLSDGPAHGYGVIERLRDRSDHQLDLAEGTVYPALHRLESRGDLTASWHVVQGRRRKVYEVSGVGAESLAGHRRQWLRTSGLITQLLGAGS